MLIPSRRHTAADLALWRELESADLIHAESLMRTSKVERSIQSIREFAEAGSCYASVSWGKDSTVLADLVCEANRRFSLDVPLAWITYGRATNPGCRDVRDAFLARRRVAYREFDVGEEESRREDYSPATRFFGTERYILGIRADESGARKISMRHLGVATKRSCRPLGWWTLDNVFAYLAMRSLPVHENYAMLGGGRWPREHVRTASIGGERGVERGRREWEREYYGDVLRRLEAGKV